MNEFINVSFKKMPYCFLNDGTMIYVLWFDLDEKHETYIEVSTDEKFEDILAEILEIKEQYDDDPSKVNEVCEKE